MYASQDKGDKISPCWTPSEQVTELKHFPTLQHFLGAVPSHDNSQKN